MASFLLRWPKVLFLNRTIWNAVLDVIFEKRGAEGRHGFWSGFKCQLGALWPETTAELV